MLLSFGAAAQDNNIQVKSFRMLEGDMTTTSQEGKRLDQNNEVAALIKIVTTETGFTFEAGALGIVDSQQRNGEVWVWVPRASRKITILNQKLGVLRNYPYPVEIQADRTYEMVLTTAKVETIIKEQVRMQYLGFQISPSNATLWVNDEIWELEPDGTATQFLNFGTYTWRVQAPNYHPDAGKVTLNNANETELVTVNMKPNFGWIEVAGNGPLKDASVYIDDNFVGKAPCKSEALKSGSHTVRVVKKMYATYSQTVTVSDSETTRLAPTLTADFAEVTLKVDADAGIYVNDERKGTRSWTGALGSGSYKIECKQANHETSQTMKEITANMAGQTITLPAPKPIYGSLNVESSPNFCQLFIDGQAQGKTPKFISEILVGSHEIRLTKEGYADYMETVTIAQGARVQVKATMNKQEIQQLISTVTTDFSKNQTFTVGDVSFTMVYVEGGTFTMGATSEQGTNVNENEKPAHIVTLSSYSIGQTEVTQELWQVVMGSNPIETRGKKYPVTNVTWNDCEEFIRNLNAKTGKSFRLPTEAEWEFAARGGNKSRGYKFSGSDNIHDVSCNYNNSSEIFPVATKLANELGIYDMSGNVFELCNDFWGEDYYKESPQMNPQGPSASSFRVCRGNYRVAFRRWRGQSYSGSDLGFRIAL